MTHLQHIGWTKALADVWASLDLQDCVPARIACQHPYVYDVIAESGTYLAELTGKQKLETGKKTDMPVVGDWVALATAGGQAVIRHLLPRYNVLRRQSKDSAGEAQALAANVDLVLIVMALDAPLPLPKLSRFATFAYDADCQPVLLGNKCDLVADPEQVLAPYIRALGDIPVRVVSAKRGDGIPDLLADLASGKTAVFVGPSGVGKSALINACAGNDMRETGDIRAKDGKGRHTTTHRQLLRVPDHGMVIDTPGIREIHVWVDGLASDTILSKAFADISELGQQCKFRNCSHVHEPNCAVQAAVASGDLARERYDLYCQNVSQLASIRTVITAYAQKLGEKNRSKIIKDIQRRKKRD